MSVFISSLSTLCTSFKALFWFFALVWSALKLLPLHLFLRDDAVSASPQTCVWNFWDKFNDILKEKNYIQEFPSTFDPINRELNFDCAWGGRLSCQSWLFLDFSEEVTKAGRPLCVMLLVSSLIVLVGHNFGRSSQTVCYFLFFFLCYFMHGFMLFFILAGIYIGYQL